MFIKFLNSEHYGEEDEAIQSLLVKGAKVFLGDVGLLFPIRLPVHLFVIYTSRFESNIEIFNTDYMVMN